MDIPQLPEIINAYKTNIPVFIGAIGILIFQVTRSLGFVRFFPAQMRAKLTILISALLSAFASLYAGDAYMTVISSSFVTVITAAWSLFTPSAKEVENSENVTKDT